jgi:magnesium chelatase family protein
MEIIGADIDGIQGLLISFDGVIEEGSGVLLLGRATKVVNEGFVRARKAIETLDDGWVLENCKVTIQLDPPATAKVSEGLDLPIAVTLLKAILFQDTIKLDERIKKLEEKSHKIKDRIKNSDTRKAILEQIKRLIEQRKKIVQYKSKIAGNKNKYVLIGSLKMTTGKLSSPQLGLLSMLSAIEKGYKVIVPEDSNTHAALVARSNQFEAYMAKDLAEVWNIFLGKAKPRKVRYIQTRVRKKKIYDYIPDLRAINGVAKAKEAMAVAIAGGHNILLIGPPGQGKGMLSNAATKLLPDLSSEEIFEINKIYSAKGLLKGNEVIVNRPYREVNKQTREAALFGGGSPPVPGELSLAHRGLLLFDEINLFNGQTINSLRRPLESGTIILQRVSSSIEYPCNFIMVCCMNPCKCGWYNHFSCPLCGDTFVSTTICPNDGSKLIHKCTCSKRDISSFRDKLSTPLRDRIDIKVLLSSYSDGTNKDFPFSTSFIQRKITSTRKIQQERYKSDSSIFCNADIKDRYQFERYDKLIPGIKNSFNAVYKKFDLTERQMTRLLLVSRTVADLAQSDKIMKTHIINAVKLMGLDDDYINPTLAQKINLEQ